LIFFACAALAFALFLVLTHEREPEYEGRRLSEWLEPQPWIGVDSDYYKSQAAIRSIGTNALPILLKWIDYEPPTWRMTLYRKLPKFIGNRRPINSWLFGASRRVGFAIGGFEALGTKAASATPVLEAMMKDTTKPTRARAAIYALGEIGEPAIPALKAAFADTNRLDRVDIVKAFTFMPITQMTNSWLPFMLEALNDRDASVSGEAKYILNAWVPEILTNAPAP
jgi:hypothetical protein